MATIQLSLQDLMYIVGIVAGVFLIIVLWKIRIIVSNVQSIIDINKADITKTIKTLPVILDDVKHISTNVIDISDNLKDSVPVILKDTKCITSSAKESIEVVNSVIDNVGSGVNDTVDGYKKNAEGIITYIQIAEEIFKIVYKAITSKK